MRFAALRNRFWPLLTLVALLAITAQALAQADPLPSWNDGPAKRAILAFVQTTTEMCRMQSGYCQRGMERCRDDHASH
jgi:hypothetical protein